MAIGRLEYDNGLYRAKARNKSYQTKRESAADLIEQGERLAREAADEERRAAELDAEYGPEVKQPGDVK